MKNEFFTSSSTVTDHWFLVISTVWTALVACSLIWGLYSYNQETNRLMVAEANSMIDEIMIIRSWSTQHGGVYIKTGETLLPNPYLKGIVKDRDITTPSGIKLTLVNPAYMTRLLNELKASKQGRLTHTTSLRPIRQANAPDAWETKVLTSFEQGVNEFQEIAEIDGEPYMRLMRPLLIEKSCLKCHAQQGFKEGDISGGISASVPMQKYLVISTQYQLTSWGIHGLIWLFGLAGLGFSRNRLLASYSKNRESEIEILESERKYRLLVNNTETGFVVVDDQGIVVEANEPYLRLVGIDDLTDVIGHSVLEWTAPECKDENAAAVARTADEGFVQDFETIYVRPDGSRINILINASLQESRAGKRLTALCRDITERKVAAKQVKERYNLAQAVAHIGIWDWNLITKELMWSDETYRIFGLSPGECMPSFELIINLVHVDDRSLLERTIEATLSKQQHYDINCRLIRKDGSKYVVNIQGKVIETPDGRRMIGTVQDITERMQTDELLRKLSQAVEQAGESIVITNREGIIEYTNPAFTKLSGYSAEEAVGQSPGILSSHSQNADFYEEMWKTITSGQVWHGKIIDRKKDGSFYPAMLTISPINDQSGDASRYTHFVGIQSDLTQLEEMEQQFHQAQKMEAIGTLVGGIAHDFNNMLAGITGNLYLAKRKQENPDTLQKLDNIEQLSLRAADMIKQLLTFARKDKVEMKALALTSYIRETLQFLHSSVPENIEMQQDICSDALPIHGDVTQLHQILMNLINNAHDAVEGVKEPCITVKLEVFRPDDAFAKEHTYFKLGQYAHLSIGDNGCGIPEHRIEHLFEPFFTTKEQGKGTGLGLAMVFGAVKTHQGFVEVESTEGEGSTFHIFLPLIEQAGTTLSSPQENEEASGQGELILLADDEQHVRETTAEVLETMGYRVLQAEDGLEAVEVFKAHQNKIALVILDLVMPHCGGVELAEGIRKILPSMPLLFVSGYDMDEMLNDGKHIQNSVTLSKPVQFDILNHAIRGLLETRT